MTVIVNNLLMENFIPHLYWRMRVVEAEIQTPLTVQGCGGLHENERMMMSHDRS